MGTDRDKGLSRDAAITVRITVEGTSRTRINTELKDVMEAIDWRLREMIEDPAPGREILSFDIYVSGDPQLGHGSKAHRKWVTKR